MRLAFVILLVLSSASALAGSPKVDYMLNCMGCHRSEGQGLEGSVPDLRGEMGLFLGVEGGREFLIRVPGTAQSVLSDAATADLLNWMLKTFSPAEVPEGFVPFSESEVANVRQPALSNAAEVRKELMREILAEQPTTP